MISETKIANLALLKVGAKPPITSLQTDTSDNAILCRQFFGPVRDALLRSHPWNCAEHRRIITPLAEAPAFGYDNQYQLPVNPWCLRVLQVNEDDDQSGKWKVAGRRLLYNESTAKLIYTKRITDTNEFDPLLIDAFTLKLALKLAMPITQSERIVKNLVEELEGISLPEARSIDGQESSVQQIEADTWINSRY